MSGEAAEAFVSELGTDLVGRDGSAQGFVVRAKDVETLTALRARARPAGGRCASRSSEAHAFARRPGNVEG